MAAPEDFDSQLAELERQRTEGLISEITFTVQRNLLLTRRHQSARRRSVALRIAPPPPSPVVLPASRRERTRVRSRAAAVSKPPQPPPPPRAGLSERPPSRAEPAASPTVGRRRHPVRAAAWLGAALAVVAAASLLLTHFASSPTTGAQVAVTPPSQGQSTPSATQSATPGASLPAAGVTVVTLDDTRSIGDGGTVTLFLYTDHFALLSLGNAPLPSGSFYAAVQVRVCAGTAPVTLSPASFVLVEPDRSQVTVAAGPATGMQPALQVAALPPGECSSGWITFTVTAKPTTVVDAADRISWSIP